MDYNFKEEVFGKVFRRNGLQKEEVKKGCE